MRKQRFKTIRLFLKLMLLFQIYSHQQCFKAEAIETQFLESFDKAKHGEEAGLNDQTSSHKDTGLSVLERPERPARLLPLRMIL